MLELSAVKNQINRMIKERDATSDNFWKKLERALALSDTVSEKWGELQEKVARSHTSWLVASFLEPAGAYPLPQRIRELSVLAADGSQIFPDRNEVSSCFLVNIGSVAIHYGSDEKPSLSSKPTLFYKDEDLHQRWGNRRVPVDGEILGTKRTIMELEEIVQLAEKFYDKRPVVALSDGSLILWNLEGRPPDAKSEALSGFFKAMDRLRSLNVPIAGYISKPRSTDVINSLRVSMCPEFSPDCDNCPYTQWTELPCGPIEGLLDRHLFENSLEKGERSALFGSSSKILDEYGDHRTCFFYLDVGLEIARLEVPLWVARNRELLDRVHSTAFDQAEKGRGYPVVLFEAHEKAVVRGPDRELFYRLLEEALVRSGFTVRTSVKSQRKRGAPI